ncbi:hypothetical protein [Natrinema versiforme]|uniref:Glutamate--cysteine ligase n=1 Tax=Natrinema versiforme JCM 10478 TaxID=1227496 RepID=L9XV89_9EURY|nr:hypothetical protein [Natrinema versiforme]ELY65680.1 glutamate--cysteine ligase [Natrinema versiforme JCM 10478]
MKTSIEVEYWVIDSDGNLAEPGPLTDASQRPERERAEPLVAVQTPPCESAPALRTALGDALEAVRSRAAELDKRLVPLGTPINDGEIARHPDEQAGIRRHLGGNADRATNCAGTRIRFEQRNVADQLNALIALDPALALVNSSPYQGGERIANGARAYCCRDRSDESGPKRGHRWRYVETVDEWHRRLEHRSEAFKDAALEAGVDPDTIEKRVSPDDSIWTPVRLRGSMSAVEWRSPDTALPSQLLRLAADLETVMERLDHTTVRIDGAGAGDGRRRGTDGVLTGIEDEPTARPGHVTSEEIALPAFETVCDLTESAIRDGLESAAVAGYLERMGFPVGDYHPIATRIDGRQYVTNADARELRLEYASRLEEDVKQLREDG